MASEPELFPVAVPSSLVPPRPSPGHIWDNLRWRPMTEGEAVYLLGRASVEAFANLANPEPLGSSEDE